MNAATYKYIQKDLPATLKLYNEVLVLNPNYAKCLSFRANCYKQLNRFAEALEDTLKSLEIDPKVHHLTYLRAVKCHMIFGNIVETKSCIEKFHKAFPLFGRLMEEQKQILHQLEVNELQAEDCHSKQDIAGCLRQMELALKVAPECSRYKKLKEESLMLLKKMEEKKLVMKSAHVVSELSELAFNVKANLNLGINKKSSVVVAKVSQKRAHCFDRDDIDEVETENPNKKKLKTNQVSNVMKKHETRKDIKQLEHKTNSAATVTARSSVKRSRCQVDDVDKPLLKKLAPETVVTDIETVKIRPPWLKFYNNTKQSSKREIKNNSMKN